MHTKNLISFFRSLARQESGQAIIEAAITLPLLFLLLTGAAEFARVAYAAIEVSNSASAAAEYGASSHTAASDWSKSGTTFSGGIVTAATNDSANLTGTSGVSVTNIAVSCSCVNPAYTPSSCSDNKTCQKGNTAMIETLSVQTQSTYRPLVSFFYPNRFFGPTSVTLYGQATQTVSNQ